MEIISNQLVVRKTCAKAPEALSLHFDKLSVNLKSGQATKASHVYFTTINTALLTTALKS